MESPESMESHHYGFLLHDVWCKTSVMKILEISHFTKSRINVNAYDAHFGNWKCGSVFSRNNNPVASVQCYDSCLQCWKALDKLSHKGPKKRGKRNLAAYALDVWQSYIVELKLCDAALHETSVEPDTASDTPPACGLTTNHVSTIFWHACQCLDVTKEVACVSAMDTYVCDEMFQSMSLPVTAPIKDNISELAHSGL